MIDHTKYLKGESVEDVSHRLSGQSFFTRFSIVTTLIFSALMLTFMNYVALHIENGVFGWIVFTAVIMLYVTMVFGAYITWKIVAEAKPLKTYITKSNLIAFAIAVVFYIAYHIGVFMWLKMHGSTGSGTPHVELSVMQITSLIVFTGLLVPMLEELATRGLFIELMFKFPGPRLLQTAGYTRINVYIVMAVTAVIASALLSTIFHVVSSGSAGLDYLVNGMVAAILYYKTKHVIYPILYHMMNNLIAVGVLLMLQ